MSNYYPNLSPLHATRTTSLDGKRAGGSPTSKLDRLENWEGYRTFQDARSQTGWSDSSGHVIGGIDTHGYPLLFNKVSKKLEYNVHHHGGISLSDIVKFAAPALALQQGANRVLTDAGVPVAQLQRLATNIPGVGQLAGIAGQIDSALGLGLTGNGFSSGQRSGMNLGDILGGDSEGGELPDWLQTIQEGISIFGRRGGDAPPPSVPDYGGGAAAAVGSYGKWVVIGVGAAIVLGLMLSVRRSR